MPLKNNKCNLLKLNCEAQIVKTVDEAGKNNNIKNGTKWNRKGLQWCQSTDTWFIYNTAPTNRAAWMAWKTPKIYITEIPLTKNTRVCAVATFPRNKIYLG